MYAQNTSAISCLQLILCHFTPFESHKVLQNTTHRPTRMLVLNLPEWNHWCTLLAGENIRSTDNEREMCRGYPILFTR